jgi:hypothetical protein
MLEKNADGLDRPTEEIVDELLSARSMPYDGPHLDAIVEWQACNSADRECTNLRDYVGDFHSLLDGVLEDPGNEDNASFDLRAVVKAGDKFYVVRPRIELVELTKVDQLGHLLPEGDPAGDHACDNGCGRAWTEDQLVPLTAESLFALVKAGDTVPAGLCPVCGEPIEPA